MDGSGSISKLIGDEGEAQVRWVFLLIATAIIWTVTFRVPVAVSSDRLVIRNPIRTHIIRLTDIVEIEPEYEGLRITTMDGRVLTAVAIQRWNVTAFLRRRSRADDAVDFIRSRQRAVEERKGGPDQRLS